MNLMNSGFLFVLFILLEAISGLTPANLKTNSTTQDLPSDHPAPEKSHQDNAVSESVKIIALTLPPNTPTEGKNTTTTTTTTSTTTTTTTTTTTAAPHPAPTPTPAPAPIPSNGTWVVRNKTTNTVCIIAQMSMTLNITYPLTNGTLQNSIMSIPKNSNVTGNCSESEQSMILEWDPGHSLRINFKANRTAKTFHVSGFNLSINATVFTNAPGKQWRFENTSSEFTTSIDMSYKCDKKQDLSLKSVDDKLKAVLSLNDTQLEAFVNKSAVSFGAAQNCDTFDTPDIVPIAVGCALAILVLVVLVAYLIGRKRSQNRGYLSM